MKAWTDLFLSFAFGLAAGVVFAFYHFKSRLKLYKEFIEHRLSAINRFRPSKTSTWGLSKLSFWKVGARRRSEPGKRSKGMQNK